MKKLLLPAVLVCLSMPLSLSADDSTDSNTTLMKAGEMILGPSGAAQFVSNIELYYGEEIFENGEFPDINVYENTYAEGEEPSFTIPAENVSIKTIEYVTEGGEPSVNPGDEGETEEMTVLYLSIDEIFFFKTGNFIIVIPEGIVKNAEGAVNPQQEIAFTLAQTAEQPAISDYDGFVYMLWDEAVNISYNAEVEPFVVLPDGERENLYWYDFENPYGEIEAITEGISIDLTYIISVMGDGEYEVVIPEGYLNMEIEGTLHINPDVVYSFTYTSEEPDYELYTVTGVHTVYEDGVAVSEEEDFFTMTIALDPAYGDYNVYEFAGYTIPDFYGYQAFYFYNTGDGYLFDIFNGGNILAVDDDFVNAIVAASPGEEFNYDTDIEVVLPENGAEGSMGDFTIWEFDYDLYEATALLDAWSNLTITKGESTGVKTIRPASEAADAIYNLNGVKVDRNKISNGIYIINGKKVIIRK